MIKSYSNQRNRRARPENLVAKYGLVLPDNMSDEVSAQLFDVLESTKFNKLPINIFMPQRYIFTEDTNANGYKRRNANNFTSVGFIRNYNAADETFEVVVFNRYAEIASKFSRPAIDIIFMESNNELVNIIRFNLIDLEEHSEHREYVRRSSTSPLKPNAVRAFPKDEQEVAKNNDMGVTLGDIVDYSADVDVEEESESADPSCVADVEEDEGEEEKEPTMEALE